MRNRKFILTEQCVINDFNIIKGDLPYFSAIKVLKKETIWQLNFSCYTNYFNPKRKIYAHNDNFM